MNIMVLLSDVCLFSGTLLGYNVSQDTISIFRQNVSPQTQERLEEMRTFGIMVPPVKLGLSLSSGAEIDIVCADVETMIEK